VETQQIKWEIGKDMTFDDLSLKAKTMYNNMVSKVTWGETDPKDAKILALTTKSSVMEKKFQSGKLKVKQANDISKPSEIPDIRKKFTSPTFEYNNCTYWWCNQHKKAIILVVYMLIILLRIMTSGKGSKSIFLKAQGQIA